MQLKRPHNCQLKSHRCAQNNNRATVPIPMYVFLYKLISIHTTLNCFFLILRDIYCTSDSTIRQPERGLYYNKYYYYYYYHHHSYAIIYFFLNLILLLLILGIINNTCTGFKLLSISLLSSSFSLSSLLSLLNKKKSIYIDDQYNITTIIM